MFSIYQPGQSHIDDQSTTGGQLCVGVTGCGAEELPSGMYGPNRDIARVFKIIRDEIGFDYPGKTERLDIMAGWLVMELRRFFSTSSSPSSKGTQQRIPSQVAALKREIDSNLTRSFRIKDMADKFFINQDYLRELFKKSMGESPLRYLIRRRMEAAAELLVGTRHPVQWIAHSVGFENHYYFCRLFKKRFGVTPTEYRRTKAPSCAPKTGPD